VCARSLEPSVVKMKKIIMKNNTSFVFLFLTLYSAIFFILDIVRCNLELSDDIK
jgi:hypothetical protein